MERTVVQKLAYILKILVTITFVCNLLALLLVPGMVGMVVNGPLLALEDTGVPLPLLFLAVCWQYLWRVWREGSYAIMLTLFLLLCGVCTAIILWQGRKVLATILKGTPFCLENGGSLRRAAVCCFAIALFALIRVLWGIWFFQSPLPLASYCALFVPLFFLGGLLCLIMSALFRQAAELKAENDLTI